MGLDQVRNLTFALLLTIMLRTASDSNFLLIPVKNCEQGECFHVKTLILPCIKVKMSYYNFRWISIISCTVKVQLKIFVTLSCH